MFVDRAELIRAGLTVSSSPEQVSAKAAWRTPGLSSISRQGTRGQLITVDPGLQDMISEFLEMLGPVVAKAFNDNIGPLAQEAFDQWPEPPPGPPARTGLSKSLLALEFAVSADGTEITASLVNRAPYALFIRRGQVVNELIWRPGREAADRIATDLVGGLE